MKSLSSTDSLTNVTPKPTRTEPHLVLDARQSFITFDNGVTVAFTTHDVLIMAQCTSPRMYVKNVTLLTADQFASFLMEVSTYPNIPESYNG